MSIVLGLGYGDEGKGLATSFLCSKKYNPMVVRFNGGHQAGHTVVVGEVRHTFSSFGSGTLEGVPTFWSRFCTFSPTAFVREHSILTGNGFSPQIYVDPMAPVTTVFDVMHNRANDRMRNNGTVGVGFGSTIKRQEGPFKLYVKDLFYEPVCIEKLRVIGRNYYGLSAEETMKQIEEFMVHVRQAVLLITDVVDEEIMDEYTCVFEGAQGILLDMDHGFFPNVTHSHTTSKNALDLGAPSDIYYVTRSYATRHGNGYFSKEEKLVLRNNEAENNVTNDYQGEFRTAQLNPEMIRYAIQSDMVYSRNANRNLIVTCMDQYDIDVNKLVDDIGCDFADVFVSFGPNRNDIFNIDDVIREKAIEELKGA